MNIIKARTTGKDISIIYLVKSPDSLKSVDAFSKEEKKYIKMRFDEKKEWVFFDRLVSLDIVQFIKDEKVDYKRMEACRKAGDRIGAKLNAYKFKKAILSDVDDNAAESLALAEGMALGSYQFLKYKKEAADKENSLASLGVFSKNVSKSDIDILNILVDATCKTRDLINEPLNKLNAVDLANAIKKMGQESGTSVEVLNKNKIESLKMGGLLAVNKGSIDPPTFSIIEWKPKKHKNKKPVVLVGKGVVFDTGGVNLKPGSYMDHMKSDMSGAAMMATTMYAIAKAALNVHVIALIPATDNRPDGNAYVPDDIITMFDGTTVEIKNTDAEGRMILADALSYAKKYDPELVIDAATLTGAAARAIGPYGIVAMEQDAELPMGKLKASGNQVYERIAEFPFWEEYGELIKSPVADIKNIGGMEAGMITAGKFVAHFTDYPFIHLDIAGPAFIDKKDSYRSAGGTGVGVRLLFDFLKNY